MSNNTSKNENAAVEVDDLDFFKKGAKVADADSYNKREEEAAKSEFESSKKWKEIAIELNVGQTIIVRVLSAALKGENFNPNERNFHHYVEHPSCYAVKGLVPDHAPRFYSEKNSITPSKDSPPSNAFKAVWDKYGKDSVQITQFQQVLELKAHRLYWMQVIVSVIPEYPVGHVFKYSCPRDKDKTYWVSKVLDTCANQLMNSYHPFEEKSVHPMSIVCKKSEHGRDFSDSKIEFQVPRVGYLIPKAIVEEVGGKFVPFKDYKKVANPDFHEIILTDDSPDWEWTAASKFLKSLHNNADITLLPKNDQRLVKHVNELCEKIMDFSFFTSNSETIDTTAGGTDYLEEGENTTADTPNEGTSDDLPF